jgi:YqaJ-like viral recombinase domain
VRANTDDSYQRSEAFPIGCTRDALIYDPVKGFGSLETKCVFDYRVWMQDWGGGQRVPRHYDIQLQHQMMVGNGVEPHTWGVIGAWVCGEMHYFERAPIPQFWNDLADEANRFFRDVEAANEPEPFGEPVELPLLAELFDPVPGLGLFLGERDPANWKLAELARMYPEYCAQRRFYEKAVEHVRGRLIAAAKGHDEVQVPGQIVYTVSKNKRGHLSVRVKVPDQLPDEIMDPPT